MAITRRAFNALFNDLRRSFAVPDPFTSLSAHALQPSMDLRETDRHYLLTTDLPGVSQENLALHHEAPDTLSISAHTSRTDQHKDDPSYSSGDTDEGEVVWSERMSGQFRRDVRFPRHSVDWNGVRAVLKHGVLQVTVPKRERTNGEEERKRIPVQVSDAPSQPLSAPDAAEHGSSV